MSNSNIKIWYKDIANFINKDNFNIFFPTQFMSYEEKLNAIMRLSIYTMLLYYLWSHQLKISVIVVLFVIVTTIIMYEIYIEQERKTALKNFQNNLTMINQKKCIKPTKENPFINVLPGNKIPNNIDTNDELKNFYEACNVSNKNIDQEIDDNFSRNLYQDSEDIYGKKDGSQRFVSIPNEVGLNHQKKFAEWLYGDMNKTNKTIIW